MTVWGGFAAGSALGDGAAYTPATDRWRPLPASFAPAARGEHTAVGASTAMIVWGGRTTPGPVYLNTGAVLR